MASVSITGIRQINDILAAMPPKYRRAIVRKALRRAMQPVHRKARALVPKRTGKLKASLKLRSLKSLPGVRKRITKDVIGLSLFTGETTGGLYKGQYYGKWMEFGAPKHRTFGGPISPLPARDFMKDSYYQERTQALAVFQALVHSYVLTAAAGGTP